MGSAIWTIPGDRIKGGREHRVPLSDRALTILDEARGLHDGSGLVFPAPAGRKPMSDSTLSKLLRELDIDAVPHGFRSTFRDWCSESAHAPREVAEACLAHVVRGVEGAYARFGPAGPPTKTVGSVGRISGDRRQQQSGSDSASNEGNEPVSRAAERADIESEYKEAVSTARAYLRAVGVLDLNGISTLDYREREVRTMRDAILKGGGKSSIFPMIRLRDVPPNWGTGISDAGGTPNPGNATK